MQLRLFGAAYAFLDAGKGVCRYFNTQHRVCTVYALRPLICRVDEGYWTFFSHVPQEEYVLKTKEVCRRLRENLAGLKACL